MSLLASLLVVSLAQASDPIDEIVRQTMAQQHVPGMAVLIKKGDKILKRQAYGVASVELNAPFKEDTIFETGSIGKTFTALAAMKLVEQGKLDLKDKLKQHLSQTPAAWEAITLHHLITHTSGLPEYVLFDGLRLDQEFERAKWWEIMAPKPLDFSAGTQFQYSNSNFYLLGLIIEGITKTSLSEYVNKEVIAPTGLKSTRYRLTNDVIPGLADGYFNFDNRLGRAGISSDSSAFGAGGLVSTIDDTAQFLKAVHEGKVVSKKTLELMQTPNRLPNGRKTQYGLGWFVRKVNGQPMVSHGGNSVGYSAGMAYFPNQDLTVALGANVYAISGDGLAIRFATVFEDALKPKPPIKASDPDLSFSEKLVGALQALGGGDIRQDMLDQDMKDRLATPRGQMGLPAMRAYASIDSFEFCGTEDDAPDTIYIYRLHKGQQTFVARFTVTKDKRIYTVSVSTEEPAK